MGKLFDVSRWTVEKWIRKAEQEGVEAIKDKPHIGRPTKFNEEVQKKLEDALSKSPKEFGISGVRWDGIVVVEYLKCFHHNNYSYSSRSTVDSQSWIFIETTNLSVCSIYKWRGRRVS